MFDLLRRPFALTCLGAYLQWSDCNSSDTQLVSVVFLQSYTVNQGCSTVPSQKSRETSTGGVALCAVKSPGEMEQSERALLYGRSPEQRISQNTTCILARFAVCVSLPGF